MRHSMRIAFLVTVLSSSPVRAQQQPLRPEDLVHIRSVDAVKISPDGNLIAYTIVNNDSSARPFSQLWVMNLRSRDSIALSTGREPSGNPVWSPDGQWIAFNGSAEGKSGLVIAHADGTGRRWLAGIEGTNSPEPGMGQSMSWSPDCKRIAFVSAEKGPETEDATGDPVVITRYLYKPTLEEGLTRFNDNLRLHIFVVDIGSGRVRQLTHGAGYEHSIDWSPRGDEIVFSAEHGPAADAVFNYDLFAVNASTGVVRQLTSTLGVEFQPRWSPDGRMISFLATKRALTDRETNMEDTHVWVMNADGTGRREIGAVLDNRQGAPEWSPEGSALYFTVRERGSNHLYRLDRDGWAPQAISSSKGWVGSFSVGKSGTLAYGLAISSDTAQLFLQSGSSASKKLTDLNARVPYQARVFVDLGEVPAGAESSRRPP